MSSVTAPADTAGFIASVRAVGPAIQIQSGTLSACSMDGVAPQVLVNATSAHDVSIVLAAAHRTGAAVIPRGGGQHVGLANVPVRYDVALSIAAMDRIIAHEPADMTVTVEPGVRLADLQQRLAQHHQFLALDPASGSEATIGGVLAANPSGPLRHAFGTARDWLIGLRVVHADGTSSKSGGRVVKNVAGYDMHKLHVGGHGTLGVIVEATFKVAPLPAARRVLAFTCSSPRTACEMALAAWDAGLALCRMEALSPHAASEIAGRDAWTLLIDAAGGAAAVDRSDHDLRAIAAQYGASAVATTDDEAWSRWSQTFRPRGLCLRASMLPSQVADAIDATTAATNRQPRLSATVAAGVVRAQFDEADDDAAFALVERLRRAMAADGALVVESASVAVKQRIDMFGAIRSDFEIMRRLKEQFDPGGILSPGRFLGRL